MKLAETLEIDSLCGAGRQLWTRFPIINNVRNGPVKRRKHEKLGTSCAWGNSIKDDRIRLETPNVGNTKEQNTKTWAD